MPSLVAAYLALARTAQPLDAGAVPMRNGFQLACGAVLCNHRLPRARVAVFAARFAGGDWTQDCARMTHTPTIWTIGHSTHSADDFAALLKAYDIEIVADVRRFPGSRRHPHFGADPLAKRLAAEHIDYVWLAKLGGRRRVDAAAQHLGWRNSSFRSYAAYTWTEEFAEGLEELLHMALGRRTSMMCSELLWWRCHRALVADVLRFIGVQVVHIRSVKDTTAHPYTSPARIANGELSLIHI